MGKLQQNTKGADFFLVKFWTHMLENPECKHVCEWAPDGRHIIIYDSDMLMTEIKNRGVCKQKDYSSFARQLRIYRWGRVRTTESGESPWPSDAKVWRHPRLNRSSSLVDVANVTRNAPPKPNKAEIAAGLPEQKSAKPRKRAIEIYEGDQENAKPETDESEDELMPFENEQSRPTPVPRYRETADGNIAITLESTSTSTNTTAANGSKAAVPLSPKEIPVAQYQSVAGPSSTQALQPKPKLPTVPRPNAPGSTASTKPKATKKQNKTEKASQRGNRAAPVSAFDVEVSIFDPNNNFGVLSARPLHGNSHPNRSYRDEVEDGDSSDTSVGRFDSSGRQKAVSNAAAATVPALSMPQVQQAFLSRVVYDNAAIEHAARNPANYDRLPWSLPTNKQATPANLEVPVDGVSTLASLESRLQSISASLRAADEAAAQHAAG